MCVRVCYISPGRHRICVHLVDIGFGATTDFLFVSSYFCFGDPALIRITSSTDFRGDLPFMRMSCTGSSLSNTPDHRLQYTYTCVYTR